MPDHASRLSFVLKGSRTDAELVRAPDFADWIGGVLQCLRRLERSGSRGIEIVYRVTGLSTSSAVIELEATSEADANESAFVTTRSFLQGITGLRTGRINELPFEPDVKAAFISLARPFSRHLRQVTVRTDLEEVVLRSDDIAGLALESRAETFSTGSYSGFVDALNVHKEPVFYLYPTIGPRVACQFDPQWLLDQVRGAIRRYTTVYGLLEYAEGSPFPDRLVVDRIEVNPPVSELPTLASLHGIAPQLAGGVDSVTYVRRLRDAEA